MPRWFKVVVTLGVLIILAAIVLTWWPRPRHEPQWGVTFNAAYATYLGLDWRETFLAIQSDLGVKNWRLSVPWDEIEQVPGNNDFTDTDWMLDQVAEQKGRVILVLGRRTPRWPECHDPVWLADLDAIKQQNQTLAMLAVIVQRYRDHPAIQAWQVENEMSLNVFGNCPVSDLKFFEQEVALVRGLDASHPIYTTVSGELSTWGTLARMVDGIGTSLYRSTYNDVWGYFVYPYPALFYQLRAWLTITRTTTPVYISELQMEPWGRLPLVNLDVSEQLIEMGAVQRQRNLYLARQTGLDPVYLWGVEWWYWLKVMHHDSSWWDAMRQTINNNNL
jgi:hypothetical protein